MVWEKSTVVNRQDIKHYNFYWSSFWKVSVWCFGLGIVWTVGVTKIHGLPGDSVRQMQKNESAMNELEKQRLARLKREGKADTSRKHIKTPQDAANAIK